MILAGKADEKIERTAVGGPGGVEHLGVKRHRGGEKFGQDDPLGALFESAPNKPFGTFEIAVNLAQFGLHLNGGDANGLRMRPDRSRDSLLATAIAGDPQQDGAGDENPSEFGDAGESHENLGSHRA